MERPFMEKKKIGLSIVLEDRHVVGLSEEKLDKALDTLARFALTGILQKLDPNGRIPIEDCSLVTSTKARSAIVGISIAADREQELSTAFAAVSKDLISKIDQYGIEKLISAGRSAYG
jgi:hypothetical protein